MADDGVSLPRWALALFMRVFRCCAAQKHNICHADEQHGIELLEVYCNPNAHSTAFDAKTLITLKTSQGVRVTAEARLSALKSDLDTFLEPK